MQMNVPLADRLRPKILDEVFGQDHLVGHNGILTKLIYSDRIPSIILWGPPGTGKTTLAKIIAKEMEARFVELSATMSGVKDIRETVKEAQSTPLFRTILFIDEIHRFNKAQQDSLLPHVESGVLTLIGATTENPSFEVNSALLSRCRVLTLNRLEDEDLKKVLKRGIKELEKTHELKIRIEQKAFDLLIQASNGDARSALNTLEVAVQMLTGKKTKASQNMNAKSIASKNKVNKTNSVNIKKADIEKALQSWHLVYDKSGDEHYNTISAFIKSMRASNPDAALYYLARLVEGGEDPKFIARRMVIFASEDVGMAQPTALVVANEVFRACETIGYPECAINLAHGAVYLAKAKKDRSAYNGLRAAQSDVKNYGNLSIPKEILNAPTELMKKQGYGKNYQMYPDKDKSLLPSKLKSRRYLKK